MNPPPFWGRARGSPRLVPVLWFTEPGTDRIGRITVDGTVTEFVLPAGSRPEGIAAGPDGALWFAEYGANRTGRITKGGSISHFRIPTPDSGAGLIAAGPNSMWFTESSADRIGAVRIV